MKIIYMCVGPHINLSSTNHVPHLSPFLFLGARDQLVHSLSTASDEQHAPARHPAQSLSHPDYHLPSLPHWCHVLLRCPQEIQKESMRELTSKGLCNI